MLFCYPFSFLKWTLCSDDESFKKVKNSSASFSRAKQQMMSSTSLIVLYRRYVHDIICLSACEKNTEDFFTFLNSRQRNEPCKRFCKKCYLKKFRTLPLGGLHKVLSETISVESDMNRSTTVFTNAPYLVFTCVIW